MKESSHALRIAVAGFFVAIFASGPAFGRRRPLAPLPDYGAWLGQALDQLSGDDARAQKDAAEHLAIAIPRDADRQAVLSALASHLNGSDNDLRLKCVRAFAHWATAAQVPQLVSVVDAPRDPPVMSGAENSWAAATAALAALDPKAAQAALDRRKDNFFFRVELSRRLHAIATADVGPGQAAAVELLSHLSGPENPAPMSLADAEQLLASDSAENRGRAAGALACVVVVPGERAAVLDGLRSHLGGRDGRSRLPFVQAFAHWATAADAPALLAVFAAPESAPVTDWQEPCWATAVMGLARVDPNAAALAIRSRGNDIFFRQAVRQAAAPIAEGNGPQMEAAAWVMSLIREPTDTTAPPLPPGFELGNVHPQPDPNAPGSGGIRA